MGLVWRRPLGLSGVETITGQIARTRETALVLDAHIVGMCEAGEIEVRCPSGTLRAQAGAIVHCDPLEHAVVLRFEPGACFRAAIARPETLARVLDEAGERALLPRGGGLLADPILRERARAFFAACDEGGPVDVLERAWRDWIVKLARTPLDEPPPARAEPAPVRRAREYLHEHFADTCALDELARISGKSKFHLVRLFRDRVGLPPHQYLLRLRLGHARDLIAEGATAAEVAASVGFSDQSHFSTYFTRSFGVSPSSYAASVRARPQRP